MDNHETPEFDLDDILKEFGEEDLPDMPVDLDAPAPEPPRDEPPRDTIRLDGIRKAVQPQPAPSEDAAQAENAALPVQDDTVAVKTWQPTHEDAPADYIARDPIVFRPKNRLRELRQKLVEGPERRYYALSEIGTAKLQAAIFLHILLLLAALGGVALYALHLVPASRMRLLIFSQLLTLMLSGLLGCYRMLEGLGELLHGRFTAKTFLFFAFVACCLDGVQCLGDEQMPICAVFCLQMLFAQLAQLQAHNTESEMTDTLRKATDLYAVARVERYHADLPGYAVVQGEVEDFTEHYAKPAAPEKAVRLFLLLAVAAAIGIGLYSGLTVGTREGIRFAAAALLACAPAGLFVSMTRPAALLEKRLRKLGVVLCGWQGIRRERKAAWFPLTHEDLFPVGSVKLNGVKYYGECDPDTVAAYTTSLIAHDGGGLTALFRAMLESRGGYLFHVENFRVYENGGLGGELGGESVLVGTLQFMQQIGVELPEGIRVQQAVYTAVNGTLCGVFALSYSRTKGAAAAMQSLCGCAGLRPILVGNDFFLTEKFLRTRFRARTKRITFDSRENREALQNAPIPEERTVLALSVREGLAQKGFAVTGARVLRASLVAGAWMNIFAGVLGLAMIGTLAAVRAESLLTPQNLLLYSLLWTVPGLLVTQWTKHP